MATFDEFVNALSAHFYVPDIVLPVSTCIFVLESPHIQEVKYGAPVAGSSGGTMSKHIFGADYARFPLGLFIKKNADERINRPRLNGIGLVNVCNIPLQRTAYGPRGKDPALTEWFADMEYVRTNNQRMTFERPRQIDIQRWLVTHLQSKLTAFHDNRITLIPCGRFAQKFVRLAGEKNSNWQVIDDVPHPSYNSWDRERYRPQVEAVRRAVTAAAKTIED